MALWRVDLAFYLHNIPTVEDDFLEIGQVMSRLLAPPNHESVRLSAARSLVELYGLAMTVSKSEDLYPQATLHLATSG